jgi:isopentenyl diphosphate isomerase/L-lactate dehydrogenase-like FMN-dependent dehydrogenase
VSGESGPRLRADGFPAAEVRHRARVGADAVFPSAGDYGSAVFGQPPGGTAEDLLDRARLVPPVFMPRRLEKLIELGREPVFTDVDLHTAIGGFRSALPVFLAAFGSTRIGSTELAIAATTQAAALGVPMVIGENVLPVNGYGRVDGPAHGLLTRVRAYLDAVPDGLGGIAVQQSTEDADAEVWNLVYSDPSVEPLLATGRLAFELKLGQGAKPGLGGMTVVDRVAAERMAGQFTIGDELAGDPDRRLRHASPGTFTAEILRQQIRLMRNNFPRARVWVKLHPGRDVADAAAVAWAAGADAVTVDGAEGGTGWAPVAFLTQVGLPLGECLLRMAEPAGCLLATGRVWEGGRAVKCLALGANAVGIGRAALLAVDEDPACGLQRLLSALAMEARLLISALGQYSTGALTRDDVWLPGEATAQRQVTPAGPAVMR